MPLPIPYDQAEAGVRGAAAGQPITVPSIRAGSLLLAVVRHDAGAGPAAGLDVSEFTVSDGAIQSASLDTSGHYVLVVWAAA